ncbi:dual specificity protein kinase splB-like [Rhopalosiphum maidis]|uniref:dual specificity protein kinase splB-like n=1 Tax=Rhopalosiphum maidis TaxID=43146 RepID=UPI000F0019C2|nr:dual specificity protein kinase splB-like [Rhopalosiphum maidis]
MYAMKRSWIVLMTILQVVTLTTLTATSINSAGTTNYRQVKIHGRALDHRGDQQQMQAQVPTNRTFTGTRSRQPKTQKSVDNRRPSLTVSASVQRHQQQRKYDDSALSYLDWTPIVQHKESLETVIPSTINGRRDYQQQRQVRQPDAIVTFVTSPPPTTTVLYKNNLRPTTHVQHFDDERDKFQSGNHYQYVNASELPEGNNKRHNVTRFITNYAYGAVNEYRKNSDFGFHDKTQDKNKPSHRHSYNNGAYTTKEQNKHSTLQDVYNGNVQSGEEKDTVRQPQSYDSDFEHNFQRYAAHQFVNTDVLQPDDENKYNNQIADIRLLNQNHRKNQNIFNLLKNETKSDVLHDYPKNITTTAANVIVSIEHENNHTEAHNIYNTDAANMANEQRLNNNNEDVDDENNDFYRDDDNYDLQQHVFTNVIVDEWGNNAHHTIVDTDSKAQKHEDDRKFENLKFDQGVPKQRMSSNQYVNTDVTAAKFETDSIATYKRQSQNDEREKIEHQRRRKPSVIGGTEINPTILTTASPRQLRRKVQPSVQTRRPAVDDETSSEMLYDSQNVFGRKYNRDNHGHIITPSDIQPTATYTSRVPVVIEDVIDGDNDNSAAVEELKQPEQGRYGFGYSVLDENVGMDFGQWERREPGRTGTVTGLYRVRLPDGRTQTVEYTVGPATGYRASVTYEGVQRHPTAVLLPLVERNDSKGAETRSPE